MVQGGREGEGVMNVNMTMVTQIEANLATFLYQNRSKELIKDAILDNDFLKKLEPSQIREVVECMYERKWRKGEFLIKEGESGSHLYVLEGTYLMSLLTCLKYDHHN